MMKTARIGGGGIAGMAAAGALAAEGWDVHVYESRTAITDEGGAIVLFENMHRALERLGALDGAIANGDPKTRFSYRDHANRPHVASNANPMGGRYVYASRHEVHRALMDAAVSRGVTVHLGTRAVAADPDGSLTLDSGAEVRGDLVVAADGVGSALRDHDTIRPTVAWLGHYGIRVGIDAELSVAQPGEFWELWNGPLRLGFGRLGGRKSAAYLSAPIDGFTADASSMDVDVWLRSFPDQREVVEAIAEQVPSVAPFSKVTCDRWQAGRLAVIGDAAHGMPPHRGQGAAMAVLDAVHLGAVLGREGVRFGGTGLQSGSDVSRALEAWESEVRPIVDRTQRVAVSFCRMQDSWPQAAINARPWAFRRLIRRRALDLSLLPPVAA
ncbi:Putative n-hydroxybenzoate hydroxylase [Actinomycetales bacterium JB111]|nr:Putative n-hydroxybenzoate hydroxylase [Actinomycetales bacterium JB111]